MSIEYLIRSTAFDPEAVNAVLAAYGRAFVKPLPWLMETIAPIGQLRRKLLSRCGSKNAIQIGCVGKS